MKSIAEADVSGKTVLVRVDFDVPLKDGQVTDITRIELALPTIKYLVGHQAKVILLAHLDRPGGKVVEELRLDPVAAVLSKSLGAVRPCTRPASGGPVQGSAIRLRKVDDVVGSLVEGAVSDLGEGDVLLLENLRFNPGEVADDSQFARALANLGDLYVNEAFATCHRAHASIVGIPQFLPAYAGLRLVEEVTTLQRALEKPERPLVAIIGGAKVETKAAVVKHLARIADQVLLGGKVALAEELRGLPRVVFPRDDLEGKDIGPQTIENYCQIISKAKTIVWSGPLGIFEEPRFERGTRAVVEAVVRSSAFVVAGGGDTLAALEKFGYRDKIGFVSTGGGAMLEFLGGRKLPGLDALDIG